MRLHYGDFAVHTNLVLHAANFSVHLLCGYLARSHLPNTCCAGWVGGGKSAGRLQLFTQAGASQGMPAELRMKGHADLWLQVVIWHGMGDSCCSLDSIGRVKQLLEDKLGGCGVGF